MTDISSFDALARWYAAHCDGQWEHGYGITIETLDNPGWSLTVDLAFTELQDVPFPVTERQFQDQVSWWRCWRDNAAFHAACGIDDLSAVVTIFMSWAKSHQMPD